MARAAQLWPATDEDARDLAAALTETGGVTLTPEELRHWADTGDCPKLDAYEEEMRTAGRDATVEPRP